MCECNSIINNNITQYNVVKCDSTVDESKVQKKDRFLAITLNGTHAVRLAITFKGTDACKVPQLLFQHIYIEEHISGIREKKTKNCSQDLKGSTPKC